MDKQCPLKGHGFLPWKNNQIITAMALQPPCQMEQNITADNICELKRKVYFDLWYSMIHTSLAIII